MKMIFFWLNPIYPWVQFQMALKIMKITCMAYKEKLTRSEVFWKLYLLVFLISSAMTIVNTPSKVHRERKRNNSLDKLSSWGPHPINQYHHKILCVRATAAGIEFHKSLFTIHMLYGRESV